MDHESLQNGANIVCVMFADISGSTKLYETLGDEEASGIIKLCLDEMKAATVLHQGHVADVIGDEILATFEFSEHAVQAAETMMRQVEGLPPVKGAPLSLRIGIHIGPVLSKDGQLYGDTINTAARIVSLARARQIFTSKSTVETLPGYLASNSRDIASFALKGKREEMDICELIWLEEPTDLTIQAPRASAHKTTLKHRLVLAQESGMPFVFQPDEGPLTLGRGQENKLVIENPRASRLHARIELRRDKYVLVDSSTNGTWVRFDGENEVVLRHEELALHGSGLITLGNPFDPENRKCSLGFDVK